MDIHPVCHVIFKAIINGHQGEAFNQMQGVRQCDPLFPMLFILAIDPLETILDAATQQGGLTPLPLASMRLRMSLYLDDAAIFVNKT